MIKCKDFAPRITERGPFGGASEYEPFSEVVSAADRWIENTTIQAIDVETVVLPDRIEGTGDGADAILLSQTLRERLPSIMPNRAFGLMLSILGRSRLTSWLVVLTRWASRLTISELWFQWIGSVRQKKLLKRLCFSAPMLPAISQGNP
jgi:hypothetical protein